MTFWDMTIYSDTLNWSDIAPICELITELDLITDFDFIDINECINVGLVRSYVKLLLSSWKTYMCNLLTNSGDSYGQQLCSAYSRFLYCYDRDFMSDLQKSKRFDLIDMFNDISRYLDDIFTIDNPEFEKHISYVYPAELQLNKANTSDKETAYLDLNIKLFGSGIQTSVFDKRDDFGFPIVNFPWLSGDVPRLPSYGIYISQLVRFARCCTSVVDFHSKNRQITSKLLTQGYRYHKLRKTFGKFFRSYSELLSKFGDISFKEYLSKGISHPVFYGDLVYKLRRVKDRISSRRVRK